MSGFARICAWCGKAIGLEPPGPGTLVSHGICPECFVAFAAEFSKADAADRGKTMRPRKWIDDPQPPPGD